MLDEWPLGLPERITGTVGPMSDEQVSSAQVEYALRSTRAASYRVDTTAEGVTLALVMSASEKGRRNAAARIVRLLAEHGLRMETDDPVEALTSSAAPYGVGIMNDSTVA
jgi:hypothetical protein